MPDLPALPPSDVIRALERAGFVRTRQRGSHLFLVHPDNGQGDAVAGGGSDLEPEPAVVAGPARRLSREGCDDSYDTG